MRIGTNYGGWWIPEKNGLGPDSIVISAGVGEDISFDLGLQSRYGCAITLVDPTTRAVQHVDAMCEWAATGSWPQAGSLQPDYRGFVEGLTPKPDFSKITLEPVGLWDKKDTLRFYKQDNPAYVSQSFLEKMFTDEYTLAPVVRLSTLLEKRGLSNRQIDLLKMDIEGAELRVLGSMLDDGNLPRILCVEFDAYIKGKDRDGETRRMLSRLEQAGYRMEHNDAMNITLVRQVPVA